VGRFHCFLEGPVKRSINKNEWITSVDAELLKDIHIRVRRFAEDISHEL